MRWLKDFGMVGRKRVSAGRSRSISSPSRIITALGDVAAQRSDEAEPTLQEVLTFDP